MSKIAFTILGTCSGLPHPERVNSGYVLDIDGRLIQFDCGSGISSAFRRAGCDPLNVEKIFISHTHPDHIVDLPLFVQMIYLLGKKGGAPLDIYLPGEIVDTIDAYFRSLYLIEEKIPFDFRLLPVPEEGAVEFDGISVLPIRNTHLKKYADIIAEHNLPNKMQCYSYLIRVDKKSILYSADLGSEDDLYPYLKDIDLLVVESMHINVDRLIENAVENDVGRVVLTHIDEDYNPDEAKVAAKKYGTDNLTIAEDGMIIEL